MKLTLVKIQLMFTALLSLKLLFNVLPFIFQKDLFVQSVHVDFTYSDQHAVRVRVRKP